MGCFDHQSYQFWEGSGFLGIYIVYTLPKFNMVHLKMASWNRRFRTWTPSFLGSMLHLGRVYGIYTLQTPKNFPMVWWLGCHVFLYKQSSTRWEMSPPHVTYPPPCQWLELRVGLAMWRAPILTEKTQISRIPWVNLSGRAQLGRKGIHPPENPKAGA